MFDEKIGEENAEEEHPVSGRRFQPGFISAATPRLPAFAVVDQTNAVPSGVAGGDTLCQAMMIETGGNESNPQTASADTALNLPMGDTAVSALGELIGSSISGVLKTTGKGEDGATGADGP
ncbi:hypothetical protein [Phenylobacterium sp.]|jgi:hypothetical protein|uniref:hypothetical protein n=1 Tax=Phenylobacterium sp. TaxID=1871053 RepID=UPI0037CC81D0